MTSIIILGNVLSFSEAEKNSELIDPKNKEDLKTIQELYETDLNIQLGTIDEDINKEDLTNCAKSGPRLYTKNGNLKKEHGRKKNKGIHRCEI
ncbi:13379_t:CDS:2 [Gigaspora margarita]|uniref:13379_t:CDS:1 n=1 Tax=Gigaspora margarita TaxID=4874 RepID=A0ABM8VXQ6_GIGMA|nr:13379_t:CDS:2 [Gigaspora margarita]